jgi:predicted metal-binding protein
MKLTEEIIMHTSNLEKYCAKAVQAGATNAKVIHPNTVVTAPWVRFKCMYGCPINQRYSCPPHTPTPAETQATLDSYNRAILFRVEAPYSKERGKKLMAYLGMLVELEGEIFKDGYYKAFVMLAGPCSLCKECGKVEGVPCSNPGKSRPAMEAFGIDVYQTARNNDFFITPLKDKSETQNLYCLMLVD